jgi:hypothetical protein
MFQDGLDKIHLVKNEQVILTSDYTYKGNDSASTMAPEGVPDSTGSLSNLQTIKACAMGYDKTFCVFPFGTFCQLERNVAFNRPRAVMIALYRDSTICCHTC